MTTIIPAPTTGGVQAKVTTMPGAYVNIRSQPNGTDVGDLPLNAVVIYYPNYHPETGWVYIQSTYGNGWVSYQSGGVVFTPVAIPTGGLTQAQWDRLNSANTSIKTATAEIDQLLQEVKPPIGGGGF